MMGYLTAIRDAVVTILVILIAWWVYHAGQNQEMANQIKALKETIAQNNSTMDHWRQESTDAYAKERAELDLLHAGITGNTRPVVLQVRPPSCPVSVPAPAGGGVTGAGADDKGSGGDPGESIDVRPKVNAFELQYEGYFATCRRVLNSWPDKPVGSK